VLNKKKAVFGSLIIAALMLSIFGGSFIVRANPTTFAKTIQILPTDPQGNPINNANVSVYIIGDKGGVQPIYLNNNSNSVDSIVLTLPYKLITTTNIDGKLMPVYQAVNILVIVNKGDDLLGTLATAIDVPSDSQIITLDIHLFNITTMNASPSDITPLITSGEASAWNTVLRFATCTNVTEGVTYPISAQVRQQSLFRYDGQGPWNDNGYTDVTLTRSVSYNPGFTGNYTHDLQFYLNYTVWNVPVVKGYIQYFAAEQTTPLPISSQVIHNSWTPSPPSSSDSFYVDQVSNSSVYVTGGSSWVFTSAGVTFGYPWGFTVGFDIGKENSPQGTLNIQAGSWNQHNGIYYQAKCGDSSTGNYYLDTRTAWAPKP
jgi:hypothetical protein